MKPRFYPKDPAAIESYNRAVRQLNWKNPDHHIILSLAREQLGESRFQTIQSNELNPKKRHHIASRSSERPALKHKAKPAFPRRPHASTKR